MSELCGIEMSNLWFLENGQRNTYILILKSITDVPKVGVKELM
jgi:hypothetical protein